MASKSPQERRTKTPPFPVISAKVRPDVLVLIDHAADIKGWARQRVVEEGSIQYATLIVAEASARTALARKHMRSAKARLGGLAKARNR
jgi:uncharacterized protein (DUF1778 family)